MLKKRKKELSNSFYYVVFKGRIPGPFTYHYSRSLPNFVRVKVLLRNRLVAGIIVAKLSLQEIADITFTTQPIKEVLDETPQITSRDFSFAKWLSRYYFTFLGDSLSLFVSFAIPSQKKKSSALEKAALKNELTVPKEKPNEKIIKKAAEKSAKASKAESLGSLAVKNFSLTQVLTTDAKELLQKVVPLTLPQKMVVDELAKAFLNNEQFSKDENSKDENSKDENSKDENILNKLSKNKPNNISSDNGSGNFAKAALLEGVTGSGKSYVYAALAKMYLQRGFSVLMLVPEISIAMATNDILADYIPASMLHVFHSKQAKKKKIVLQSCLSSGIPVFLLGTRSALFLPHIKNMALVIVDEEHEDAYKNNYAPRYHVRQAVQYFCKIHKASLLFGSATPSVETMHYALQKEMLHCKLLNRHNPSPQAEVQMLDVRRERIYSSSESVLLRSETLQLIDKYVGEARGVMVFVNRRGFSSVMACLECGHFPMCPSCDVGLTFYKQQSTLRCHYCNFTRKVFLEENTLCDSCGKKSGYSFYKGGTEKVADYIQMQLPQANVSRFDSEAASTQKKIGEILKDFRSGKTNVLVGTQMLSKGHNFPLAGLMVMLRVENILALPDFRASERLYRTIVQARGRVGRSEARKAQVLMETTYARDKTVLQAIGGQQAEFYAEQLNFRELFFYPPFARLIKFVVRSPIEKNALITANKLCDGLLKVFSNGIKESWAVVLSAAPCFFTRLQGSYRFQVLLKVQRKSKWQLYLRSLHDSTAGLFFAGQDCVVEIDVDPVDLF